MYIEKSLSFTTSHPLPSPSFTCCTLEYFAQIHSIHSFVKRTARNSLRSWRDCLWLWFPRSLVGCHSDIIFVKASVTINHLSTDQKLVVMRSTTRYQTIHHKRIPPINGLIKGKNLQETIDVPDFPISYRAFRLQFSNDPLSFRWKN